jgi:tRNA dimethylallyltransferase
MYQELVNADPAAARRIDPRNVRRVIRALEVHQYGKTVPSPQKEAPLFKAIIVGLTADRAELYRRIDQRVDKMIVQGLVEEVKRLGSMGYDFSLPAMTGIGYKQIGLYLKGKLTLADAIQQIKFETHRLVRHQYNWFRLKDSRIKWFNISKTTDTEIIAVVAKLIEEEKAQVVPY